MNEASKTRALWGDLERGIITGHGIDIGCGPDPITPNVRKFDVNDGDANEITKYVREEFDFVFSAHCLEHMRDPARALREWWILVRPGGYLILIVPDEELYEQGYWPSLFNADHKASFTLSKQKSPFPHSHNIQDLVNGLENAHILSVQRQDQNYNRRLLHSPLYPRAIAFLGCRLQKKAVLLFKKLGLRVNFHFLSSLFRLPVDQTLGDAVAQIQTIVQKKT